MIDIANRHWTRRFGAVILCAAVVACTIGPGVATAQEKPKKSPRQAFLRSLLIPGWGEYYSGAKYRAAGFLGAEALTWIAWASWRSKGADLRAEFRQFADQNWNEQRYREWQVYNRQTGSRYIETETLPTKEEDIQQYYELVGKYAQFIYGWSDVAGQPLSVDNQQIDSSVQQQYETMRNESNKYLKRASVVIGLTVVNHVISAIHASAYTKHKWGTESRVWVGLSPVSPSGREGMTAVLSARF